MPTLTPCVGPATWKQIIVLTVLAALLPIYLLLSLPPLWISLDSIGLTTHPIGDGVLPHYPPLYPLFTRSLNYLTMWLFGDSGQAVADLSGNFSDAGIYCILGTQHALGVLALVIFTMTAARTLPRRILVLLILLLNPTYFLSTHALATEGLWLPLIVLAFASILPIWRAERPATPLALAGYFLVLYLNILVRHTGVVVAGVLPVLLGLRAMANRTRADALRWLAASTLTFLAFFAAGQSADEVCRWFEIEPRSIWGRAAVYRLAALDWDAIGLDEKARLIAEMQSLTEEPLVRQAIPRAFADKNVWAVLWGDLRRMVDAETPALPLASRNRETDRILNEICRLFFLSARHYLWASIGDDFFSYLNTSATRWYPFYILRASRETYAMFLENEYYQQLYRNVSVCDPCRLPSAIESVADFYENNLYVRATKWYSQTVFLVLVFGMAVLGWAARRIGGKEVLFTIVALLSVVGYLLLISVVTIMVVRYLVYAANVFVVCLGTLLGGWRGCLRGPSKPWPSRDSAGD